MVQIIGLGWPLVLFIVGLVLAIILVVFFRTVGFLLLALVLYEGLNWQLSGWVGDWIPWIFWILWFVGLIAWLIGFVSDTAFWIAYWSSRVLAVLVAVMIVLAGVQSVERHSVEGAVKDMVTSVQSQLDTTNANIEKVHGSLDDNQTIQKGVDQKQDEAVATALASIDSRLSKVEGRVSKLETRVSDIENGVTMTPSPRDMTTTAVAKSIGQQLYLQGFKPSQVAVGTVNWDADPIERGQNAFHQRIESTQEMRAYLNGSSASSQAARAHERSALSAFEYQRALTGEGFVPVQFNVPICYSGNGYFLNGSFKRDGNKCHAAGDVIWVYVQKDGYVNWDASIRADCGNPSFTKPPSPNEERKHPGSTPSPSTTRPTTSPTTSPSTHPTTSTSTTTSSSTTSTTTSSTTTTPSTTPSTSKTCSVCVTKPTASQTVPAPVTRSTSVPAKEPSAQSTTAYVPSQPAPSTSDGYNGGSTTQSGQTSTATPVSTVTTDKTGDPGGF